MKDGGTASVNVLRIAEVVEMPANDWGRDCSMPSGHATQW